MVSYIAYCMGIFFTILELIVLLYLIQSFLYLGKWIQRLTLFLVIPILVPMRILVSKSILNTFTLDLSPYILFVILFYLNNICDYLLA